ncbi:hypothetical protein [Amaricoccus tamworthensis]|uniref:hypothetical protein n=1 Tax=Amaricoccus tamworthensis TaxID=57002 RepID=UPI003C7CEF56
MKTRYLFAIILTVMTTPLAAQSTGQGVDIPPAEWLAMAAGRTLTYRLNGEFWALEHYHEGTNRVSLELRSGECVEGTWEYQEPWYCFHWEVIGTSCFRHAMTEQGEIIIEPMAEPGTNPSIQHMTGISNVPLNCTPPSTS